MNRPPTIFVDLDGTLVRHQSPPWDEKTEWLPGAHQMLREWWNQGAHIVITTGRPECVRQRTEAELARLGFYYHQLVMGITSGDRYLINDKKPLDPARRTAVAINVERNIGLVGRITLGAD